MHAALHPTDGSQRPMSFEAPDATATDDLPALDRGPIGNAMATMLVQAQPADKHVPRRLGCCA